MFTCKSRPFVLLIEFLISWVDEYSHFLKLLVSGLLSILEILTKDDFILIIVSITCYFT